MSQSAEDDAEDDAEDGLYSVADTVNAKADESEFKNRDAMKEAQNAALQHQDERGESDPNQDNSANSGESFTDNQAPL